MSEPLEATVIVCTHNRPAALERCLQSLAATAYARHFVTVVDSAPEADAAQKLAEHHGAEYIRVPIRGLSRARNAGARAARTDIIAYLDDDMVPHPGWLGALIAEFEDPQVVAVTGPVLPLERMGDELPALEASLETSAWGPRRFQVDRSTPEWFERANFGDVGDGNMAARRAIFDRFGGFDERLGRGEIITSGEEHYAYFRWIEMGDRVAYAPRAIVFHPLHPQVPEYRLELIEQATAYAAFVAFQHPRYAWRVARFFIEGLTRRKRAWRRSRSQVGSSLAQSLTITQSIAAFVRGILRWQQALRKSPAALARGDGASVR